MSKWIYFAIASAVGGFARYFLAGFIYQIFGTSFPYGTLIVNLIGCFLVGLLATLADDKFLLNPQMRLILMIGFCGAFTTFSTFMFETSNLIRDGETVRALLNVLISVVIGFFVFRAGVLIGRIT